MQHYEEHLRQLEAKHKSLNDAMMDIKKVIRNSEGQIGEACEAARMLTAIVQRMYPTEDTNTIEVEQV